MLGRPLVVSDAENAPEKWVSKRKAEMLPVWDECQLLKAVQPIFALQTRSVVPPPPAGSVLEDVIRNFETVFEFEMLQSSDILPEVEALALSGNLPAEVISSMKSLLQVLESQVSTEAMDLCPDQKIVRFLSQSCLLSELAIVVTLTC